MLNALSSRIWQHRCGDPTECAVAKLVRATARAQERRPAKLQLRKDPKERCGHGNSEVSLTARKVHFSYWWLQLRSFAILNLHYSRGNRSASLKSNDVSLTIGKVQSKRLLRSGADICRMLRQIAL
jgi:hypothetical protein